MIEITDAAITRVKAMKEEEGDPSLMLRVGVKGGGCSGLSYGLGFDTDQNEDDTVIDKSGLGVLIDGESRPVINGLVIDYKENMMGGGFTMDNPNALLSCGCGASFRTKENVGTPENC
ncbi:HesB/IscA family protein [Natribacillus halophilus]|uniref:Iron-sulfur cluster assembly protein n=1 Tax=Natribacillus halophilus TaxID=549003 RepID=A0A1G8RPT2_9BACI|nr:iron-sulfur cluster assembly accessory protein [Natribacillus halophilus]SDJ18913.1 iron-sulfur cluster assembly protein [Natribacillus halophilus]